MRLQAVNKVHQPIDDLIHDENYQSDNNGSYHHDDRRLYQLFLAWPGGLVTKLVVSLLYIRQ